MPILYWNSQHDWVTFRHVAVQAGVAESKKASGIRWLGPLEYVVGQFALLLGYWFVVWVLALVHYRPRAEIPVGTPLPVVDVGPDVRRLRRVEPAQERADQLAGVGVPVRGGARRRLAGRVAVPARHPMAPTGIRRLPSVSESPRPFSPTTRGSRPPSWLRSSQTRRSENPTPARMFDPAARLKGWRYLGGELDQVRAQVRETEGADPVLAGLRWDVPGLLSIYTDGHPQAYSLGLVLRYDRHSQYDLWHPNPADDAQAFRGRTFVVVAPGDPRAALAPAFESVGAPQEVVYRENGRPLAIWYVCVCRGYRGIDPAARPAGEAGH